tara:strand:- start:116 stop:289 length:174 start_codon:yes stop_codon:yes gene_type:complete
MDDQEIFTIDRALALNKLLDLVDDLMGESHRDKWEQGKIEKRYGLILDKLFPVRKIK